MSAVRFGEFEIVGRLGAGGMAETFVAVRTLSHGVQKRVALKRIARAHGNDPDFVRAFTDEARLVARLEHPNVCALYDFGREDDEWWMALELVEGADLRTVLERLRERGQLLPEPLVCAIAIDLASAFEYAHALEVDGRPARIVHRDVSPSNVLVSYQGAIKLADFGIAKASTRTHVTQSGIVKGKVPYMAPEQALGGDVDGRADLWALGVILYEALAGRRPFDGPTDLATLLNVSRGHCVPIDQAAPRASPVLHRAVNALLSVDREARPATGAELLELLAPIPPPTNARRNLGDLVRSLVPPRAAPSDLATTPSARPAATAPREPEPAPPDAPTRTRAALSGAPPSAWADPPLAIHDAPTALHPAGAPATTFEASTVTRVDPPPPRGSGRLTMGRRALVAGAVAPLLALAAGLAARAGLGAGEPAAEGPVAAAPASAPPAHSAPVVEPTPAGAGPAAGTEPGSGAPIVTATPAPDAGVAAGTLIVTVYPWADVWIDGEPAGRAPVRRLVAAGAHVVSARQRGGPSASRRVEVAAGRTQRVHIPLD